MVKRYNYWQKTVIMFCFMSIGLLFVTHNTIYAKKGWEKVGKDRGVNVMRKQVKDSPLMAFRGETVEDISLDMLIATFTDPGQRKYWVDKYHSHKTFKKTPLMERYWIRFDLPIIVSDRDYVLESKATIDKEKGIIEVNIKSITNKKFPENCCVRAEVKRTYYRFTALSRTKTRLEVEVHTDPKGLLPNFLVNMIQKKWPSKTLSGLIKQARKTKGSHPDTLAWLKEKFPG
jgi:hypothetical protein